MRRERVERLIALTQRQALASRQALGRAARPRSSWRAPAATALLHRGRTRQNVTVNLSGAVEPGAIVTVEVTAATSTTLRGTTV